MKRMAFALAAVMAVGLLAFSPMAAMAQSPPDDAAFYNIDPLGSGIITDAVMPFEAEFIVTADRTTMLPDLVPSTGGEDEDDAAGPCLLTSTLTPASPISPHRLHEDPGRCSV